MEIDDKVDVMLSIHPTLLLFFFLTEVGGKVMVRVLHGRMGSEEREFNDKNEMEKITTLFSLSFAHRHTHTHNCNL